MKKIALIYNNRVHNIFEAEEVPVWPPYPDGQIPLLIDITNKQANEGDGYNPDTEKIIPIPETKEKEGHYCIVTWDNSKFDFSVDYIPHNNGGV